MSNLKKNNTYIIKEEKFCEIREDFIENNHSIIHSQDLQQVVFKFAKKQEVKKFLENVVKVKSNQTLLSNLLAKQGKLILTEGTFGDFLYFSRLVIDDFSTTLNLDECAYNIINQYNHLTAKTDPKWYLDLENKIASSIADENRGISYGDSVDLGFVSTKIKEEEQEAKKRRIELIKAEKALNSKRRKVINVCPRVGKTYITTHLILYALTLYNKSINLVATGNKSILLDYLGTIKGAINSKNFQMMFPSMFEKKSNQTITFQTIKETKNNNTSTDEEIIENDIFGKIKKNSTVINSSFPTKIDLTDIKVNEVAIVLPAGGRVLFKTLLSSITGVGFGCTIDTLMPISTNIDNNGNKILHFSKKAQIAYNNIGGGIAVVDDPNMSGDSINKMEKAYNTFEKALLSRSNNVLAPIVVVQQRIDPNFDFSALLKKSSEKFCFYKFPLYITANEDESLIRTEQEKKRQAFVLARKYEDSIALSSIKNLAIFNIQYQQDTTKQDTYIDLSWFGKYNKENLEILQLDYLFATVDTAMKVGVNNDFSVCSIWKISENNLYLIDVMKGKYETTELKEKILALLNKYKKFTIGAKQSPYINSLNDVYIEDASSGVTIIQDFKKSETYNIIEVKRKGKMEAINTKKEVYFQGNMTERYNRIFGVLSSGRVKLPESSNYNQLWLNQIENEIMKYNPISKHVVDDFISTMFDAIEVLIFKKNNSKGKVDLARQFILLNRL